MKISSHFLVLPALLFTISCQQIGSTKHQITFPAQQQRFIDQLQHAAKLIPDSLDDDRKKFLEDSLKTSIDQWLSDNTGMKADRWLGIVINDTLGQSFGAGHGNVLQLSIPTNQTHNTSYNSDSFVVTMAIDDADPDMVKTRKELYDGDTVLFSGYFTPASKNLDTSIGSDFFTNPSFDFNPTALYKKGIKDPPVVPEPDTLGLSKAPAKVTANVTSKKIDELRLVNVKVTVKNISDKKITKLTARWLMLDKNGKPAIVDGATGVWYSSHFNEELEVGESITEEWQYASPNGTQIQLAYPKFVTFYNGTKWKTGKL